MTDIWSEIERPGLGMGCWAIGGPFSYEGRPVGWGPSDDTTSRAAIAAAFEAGIRVFDTAQAYGTGHSEALLGEMLEDRPEARIVTKVGIGIDPATRSLTGLVTEPAALEAALDGSLRRLRRERIDLVLVHPNEFSIDEAAPVFDWLGAERERGRIAAFGWSTDFPDKAVAYAGRPGYRAVEFAANLFFRADGLRPAVSGAELLPLIRSPLAMGLLAGRIGKDTRFAPTDVRARDETALAYFEEGRPNPDHLARIDAVRELLTTGGRSLAQGALGWLWALEPGAIPVPGMRTPAQVADLAGAREKGPLPRAVFDEIEALIERPEEGPARAR
ncbi:MAG: aldo/keto reductase [Paracoccaceae bacterium]|nr:aldo/keto reductase [Paracoccaceae bacterium]